MIGLGTKRDFVRGQEHQFSIAEWHIRVPG